MTYEEMKGYQALISAAFKADHLDEARQLVKKLTGSLDLSNPAEVESAMKVMAALYFDGSRNALIDVMAQAQGTTITITRGVI